LNEEGEINNREHKNQFKRHKEIDVPAIYDGFELLPHVAITTRKT